MLLDNSKIFVPGISRNFWINLQLMELKCIKQKVRFYFLCVLHMGSKLCQLSFMCFLF